MELDPALVEAYADVFTARRDSNPVQLEKGTYVSLKKPLDVALVAQHLVLHDNLKSAVIRREADGTGHFSSPCSSSLTPVGDSASGSGLRLASRAKTSHFLPAFCWITPALNPRRCR
jgi:hypothetical protein